MFLMAGRMVGHSFIHGGPCLSGISPAVIHVLLGRPAETATIQLQDCPDLDHRATIQLLEGDDELSDQDKKAVLDLALSWDLPGVTNNNRHWLFNRLLHHAVLRRTIRQIKQFRRGLKDTKVWSLLLERPDVVPLLFPRNSEAACCAQTVLDNIIWPAEEEDDDDDDDTYPLHIKCRIAEYLPCFIESACVGKLQQLVKFWVGWELPSAGMKVKVICADHPRSSTCFQILRLPGHYSTFQEFTMDLEACIATCDTGFGLI
ncbi:G2/M phase-specific E3 ubiquitin-protein ligase-like [Cyprinus carpio]|uniref:G2/M phase-specific E3 ubiquitin-protein ligase-like n=1 Tax=Cyprinus carpio TaxID=7962 RepID=A0A9Q9XZD5_CYPCA|nr:G2/M phase-specific E3 ubiquitin-protein ligase-like [Cyprinus carpio]